MIKLRDYTNGKKPKYFLINEEVKKQSFLYSRKQDMLDDIDCFGLTEYKNGKIEDLKEDYTIIPWEIKEGSKRVRKDG